jgi:hypothetical protein
MAIALALVLISTVCTAQTIRSQRKLGLLEGTTGVITNIGGTRVTVLPEEGQGESVTIHLKDATGLRVGDTVRMQGGTLVKVAAQQEQPAQPVAQEAGDASEKKEAREPAEAKDAGSGGTQPAPAQSQQK